MKRLLNPNYLLNLLVISFACIHSVAAQTTTIITFNLRYDNPADSLNSWQNRKSDLGAFIAKQNPDIIGFQEALSHQIVDLDSLLNNNSKSSQLEYSWVGVGREDGLRKGEFCPIFYLTSRYRLLAWESRWLSSTPSVPSKGWDAALPRIATMAKFQDIKSKREFAVINTHLDHVGKDARLNSTKYLIEVADTLLSQGIPVIIMGDFNSELKSDPMRWIAAYRKLQSVNQYNQPDSRGTFNGFKKNSNGPEIDYIFFSSNFELKSSKIDYTDRGEGQFFSDHYPVIATFQTTIPTVNLSLSNPGSWTVQKIRLQAEYPISDYHSIGLNVTRLNVLWQTYTIGSEYRYYSAVRNSSKAGFYGNASYGFGQADRYGQGSFVALSAGMVQQKFSGKHKQFLLEFLVGARAGAMLEGELESGGGFGGLLYIAGPLSILDFRLNMGYRF